MFFTKMGEQLFILMCSLVLCQSRAIRSPVQADFSKFTCKHNRVADLEDWKTCPQETNVVDYKSDLHTTFEEDLLENQHTVSKIRVKPNAFQCFEVKQLYSEDAISVPTCPAACKLKLMDEKKDKECDHDHLLASSQSVVTVSSPRFYCAKQYRQREICLYNISLSCETNDVKVSTVHDHSYLNLADGDFIDIIDYSQKNKYPEISGSDWPKSTSRIHSKDFLLFFYSSGSSKTDENRFRIHMECAKPAKEDLGSGDQAIEIIQ